MHNLVLHSVRCLFHGVDGSPDTQVLCGPATHSDRAAPFIVVRGKRKGIRHDERVSARLLGLVHCYVGTTKQPIYRVSRLPLGNPETASIDEHLALMFETQRADGLLEIAGAVQ
ncbi:MAG: hypothetical protein QOG38_3325, partial [Hyphomicrobiales bacterium]|nr:hypothetical protein [Hyphomicrobiales bacterium]